MRFTILIGLLLLVAVSFIVALPIENKDIAENSSDSSSSESLEKAKYLEDNSSDSSSSESLEKQRRLEGKNGAENSSDSSSSESLEKVGQSSMITDPHLADPYSSESVSSSEEAVRRVRRAIESREQSHDSNPDEIVDSDKTIVKRDIPDPDGCNCHSCEEHKSEPPKLDDAYLQYKSEQPRFKREAEVDKTSEEDSSEEKKAAKGAEGVAVSEAAAVEARRRRAADGDDTSEEDSSEEKKAAKGAEGAAASEAAAAEARRRRAADDNDTSEEDSSEEKKAAKGAEGAATSEAAAAEARRKRSADDDDTSEEDSSEEKKPTLAVEGAAEVEAADRRRRDVYGDNTSEDHSSEEKNAAPAAARKRRHTLADNTSEESSSEEKSDKGDATEGEVKIQAIRRKRQPNDADFNSSKLEQIDENQHESDSEESEDNILNEIEPLKDNSVEDYVQGCEVMDVNSDEANETTYVEDRR